MSLKSHFCNTQPSGDDFIIILLSAQKRFFSIFSPIFQMRKLKWRYQIEWRRFHSQPVKLVHSGLTGLYLVKYTCLQNVLFLRGEGAHSKYYCFYFLRWLLNFRYNNYLEFIGWFLWLVSWHLPEKVKETRTEWDMDHKCFSKAEIINGWN